MRYSGLTGGAINSMLLNNFITDASRLDLTLAIPLPPILILVLILAPALALARRYPASTSPPASSSTPQRPTGPTERWSHAAPAPTTARTASSNPCPGYP